MANTIEVWTKDGAPHLRVASTGERDMSAPISDPLALIVEVAVAAQVTVPQLVGRIAAEGGMSKRQLVKAIEAGEHKE